MEVRILMREVLRDRLQNVAFLCLSSFLLYLALLLIT
jgi:hypothetical protein